jgi:hypothetical protein
MLEAMLTAMGDVSRILLNQAKPGMILGRVVTSPSAAVLAPSGMTLTADLISRLESRGIKRIYVLGDPYPGQASLAWAEASRRLQDRFSRCRNRPYLMELERHIANELAKRT